MMRGEWGVTMWGVGRERDDVVYELFEAPEPVLHPLTQAGTSRSCSFHSQQSGLCITSGSHQLLGAIRPALLGSNHHHR